MKGGDLNGVAKDDAVKGLALALQDRDSIYTPIVLLSPRLHILIVNTFKSPEQRLSLECRHDV